MRATIVFGCIYPLLVFFGHVQDGQRGGRWTVVLPVDASESGPRACPPRLRGLLERVTSPDPGVRLAARTRLSLLNWRHLSWMTAEAKRGGAERRLALAQVVRRMRDRRYAGKPPRPLSETFSR